MLETDAFIFEVFIPVYAAVRHGIEKREFTSKRIILSEQGILITAGADVTRFLLLGYAQSCAGTGEITFTAKVKM